MVDKDTITNTMNPLGSKDKVFLEIIVLYKVTIALNK